VTDQPMDPTTLIAACASTQRFIDHVREDDLVRPTPCTDWDVRALLNHLLGTLALGEALLSGTPPAVAIDPGGLPAADLVGADPAKAFRAGSDALVAVADDDAYQRVCTTPFGEMPGVALAGFTTLDILVHGWDLARATGQDPALDEDLASAVLAFAHHAIGETDRTSRIGPAVPVPPDAPVTNRLVAYLGRTP
jgi:uncharacterized protein (TIGR03086 family)